MNTSLTPTDHNQAATPRYWYLDAFRGAAIVGMVLYHFVFIYSDLSGVTAYSALYGREANLALNPGMIVLARIVEFIFLFLVGFSMHLSWNSAQRSPTPFARFIVRQVQRLVYVMLAAGAVTVMTYVYDPEWFVYWGILHHIMLISMMYMLLTPLPWWVLLFGFPFFVLGLNGALSYMTDLPWIIQVAMGAPTQLMQSYDYFGLFPWMYMSATGFLTGVMFLRVPGMKLPQWKISTQTEDALSPLLWMGRNALPLYLLHLPLVWLLARVLVDLGN